MKVGTRRPPREFLPDDPDDDLDFEPIILSQPRRRWGLWLALGALIVLGGGAAGSWYFLDTWLGESIDTSVPLIPADDAPIKVRPEKPGGMEVPDQDKLVYDRMEGTGDGQPVEQLLPPAENPMPLSEAPPPPEVTMPAETEKPAQPQTQVAETAEKRPAGPISLVPGKKAAEAAPAAAPAPPPAAAPTKKVEAAEQLLPEPEKPEPAQPAAAPAAPPPPPAKPAEAKPAKPAPPPPAPPPPAPTKPAPTKPAPAKPAAPPPEPPKPVKMTPPKPAETKVAVAGKPPPPEPAKPVVKKTTKPAAMASSFRIQIASVRSPKGARDEWKRLQRKNRELLGDLQLSIEKADLGAKKGIYYRLRAGPVADAAAAKSLCAALKKRKVDCLIVRPK